MANNEITLDVKIKDFDEVQAIFKENEELKEERQKIEEFYGSDGKMFAIKTEICAEIEDFVRNSLKTFQTKSDPAMITALAELLKARYVTSN